MICGCNSDWSPESFIESAINEIKGTVGSGKVILGLSGGIDPSVSVSILRLSRLKIVFWRNYVKQDPEEKRKVIGNEFISVFDLAAEQIKDVDFLAQGTIYPDRI